MKKTLLIGLATMFASYGFAQTTTPAAHDAAVTKDMHNHRDSINAKSKRIDSKEIDIKGDRMERHEEGKAALKATAKGNMKTAKKHGKAVQRENKDIKKDKETIKQEKMGIKENEKQIEKDKKMVPAEQK